MVMVEVMVMREIGVVSFAVRCRSVTYVYFAALPLAGQTVVCQRREKDIIIKCPHDDAAAATVQHICFLVRSLPLSIFH